MRILFFILVLTSLSHFQVNATHIIGGEITYSCLGDNQYEVTLTVFRDCYNGVPPFDDTVSIGVFNFKNELIYDIRIPYMKDDTIKQTLIGDCRVIPPNVCVHTSIYRDTVELKPILGGYTLVYQRCCRNKTIVNIVSPDETGASFIIQISEKALLECNSSPKFKYWPPIYICANEPILFDHSAFDPDGDSIIYKLCTPTNGLKDIPQPQPPLPPPYDKVVWNDPPYNINNLMGGVPLMIDSKTGLLTGVPNTLGQFVVGICIEEFRDGKLISTTTRDFQYNVGLCGETSSSFFVPDVNCDGLTVNFSNLSQNANQFLWDFGDLTTKLDESSLFNPSYTYPDTGTYTITLIAQADEMCKDTIHKTIKVYKNSLIPDYKIKLQTCTDSMVVFITDSSIDTLSNIISWKYFLRIGGVLKDSSTLKNPVFVGDTLGIWEITLIVENEKGCVKSRKRNIVFPKLIKFDFPTDTLFKCFDQDIIINVPLDSTYIFNWTPGSYLSDSTSAKPLCSAPVNQFYTLNIKDKNSICNVSRDLWVVVAPKIQIDLPDSLTTCENDFSIKIAANVELNKIYLSYKSDFSEIIDSSSEVLIKNFTGEKTLYVQAFDKYGCNVVDSVKIFGYGIFYNKPENLIICPGDTAKLIIGVEPNQQLSIIWQTDNTIVTNGFNANIFPSSPGVHSYPFEIFNNFGCQIFDTLDVFVVDTEVISFFNFYQCAGKKVYVEGIGPNAKYYNWSVFTGDSIQYLNKAPFIFNFKDTGYYEIKAWIPGTHCVDTLSGYVKVKASNVELSYSLQIPNCNDSLDVILTNTSQGYDAGTQNSYWITSEGGFFTPDTIKLHFEKAVPNFSFTLIIDQNNGCVDSLTKYFFAAFIPTIPNDTLQICSGEEIQLKYDTLGYLAYSWEPSSIFSDPTASYPIISLDNSIVITANVMTPLIDSLSCKSSFQVFIDVLESPEYTLKYDSVICDSSSIIQVITDPVNMVSWYTSEKYETLLGISDTLQVKPKRYSNYYGILTGISGCADTFQIGIKNLLPDILPIPAVFCAGDTAIISYINLVVSDTLVCTWSPQDLVFEDQNTGNMLVTGTSSFVLTLNCINQFGCSISKQVPVDIFEYYPPLVVGANPDTIFIGESSQLNSTFDNSYIYNWTPSGSLNSFNIFNPIATPVQSTEYNLKIVNQDGCRNEANLLIVVVNPVCEEPFQYIPNAFSPNGDLKNDKFYIRGDFIDRIKLSIYNRWGELVFYTEDKNEGWDGTFKGSVSAQDVYGYQVEFLCADGKQYFKKGNLTLIR